MNVNDLVSCEEISGDLTTLRDGRKVKVDDIIFYDSSLQKIKNAIRCNGKVKKEDQTVDIAEISIFKEDYDTFMEGQSSVVRRGNTYAVTSDPVSPIMFKGIFKAGFRNSACNGMISVCEIELGRISFDIGSNKEYTDDLVCFRNVTATLFPHIGHYTIKEITGE